MPLSKERMRERKRSDRALVKPMSNLDIPSNVKPGLARAGIIMEGNRIVGLSNPVQPSVKPTVPIEAPELDADGHPIPDYW